MKEDKTSQRCPYCGGKMDLGGLVTTGSFAAGGLTGSGVLYSSYKNKKARVWVSCGTCLKCGHIELFVDPNQLREAINTESFF